MNKTQLACYFLTASALVLGGLLVVGLNDRVAPAQAEMVLNTSGLTMMTARSAESEEAMFVIDNTNQKMLVYTTDLRGTRGDLKYLVVDLGAAFGSNTTTANKKPARSGK